MFFTFFLLSSIFISTVNAWGFTGHSLIAQIAQSMLTKDSQKFVRDYLPRYTTGNLSMLSSWPDTIVYPDKNPVDYLNWQWSKQLHYVNTPDWICKYNRKRDCDWTGEQGCVDGAIQNYTERLADKKQNDIQRQEALKFLVHFIGDVHQPLHAGFVGDKGGNSIRGSFFNKSTNLHSLWDTVMIQRRISLDFYNNQNKYYNYLLNELHTTYANNISEWSKCPSADESQYLACSTAWINEDVELNCKHVYRDEQNKPMDASKKFHLGEIYYNTRMVIVEQRLIQSGVRLGVVINKIVELQKHKHHEKEDGELCSGTLFLILVIFLEALLAFFAFIYYLIRRKLCQQLLNESRREYHIFNGDKT